MQSSKSMNFDIESLGPALHKSPIELSNPENFTPDDDRIIWNPHLKSIKRSLADSPGAPLSGFELAGPRSKLFFDPTKVRAAIVTCGGLCPGINAVIRSLVLQLWHRYGCTDVTGIRFGYHGLGTSPPEPALALTPDLVAQVHMRGGTMLGSSRGTPSVQQIVDSLVATGINMLFTIGGDGTMRGALAISQEIKRRGLQIAVVGVPKTIDNDIPFVRRSFGFETAVSKACESIHAAHVEAEGVENGIGLVRLMGRDSGYIAANATLATGQVNFCLVPEIEFGLEGPGGLYELLEARLTKRRHAVIVTAEGAGQQYFAAAGPRAVDASGNTRLGDIGIFLKERITTHFKQKTGRTVHVKYIDPSYIIRASAADAADQLFCARLAQNAVHAAMAGKTGLLIGWWHGRMTHVPLAALGQNRQRINPEGELWFNVLETTGQPFKIGKAPIVS
jgi:6-phosphofructokinase 1